MKGLDELRAFCYFIGMEFQDLKYCPKCDTVRLIVDFHRQPDKKDGRCTHCKYCKARIHHLKKEIRNKSRLEFRVKNRTRLAEASREWRINNPEKHRLTKSNYQRKKLKTDTKARLIHRLRRRVKQALDTKGARKTSATKKLFGCTPEELKTYLEAKFTEGMTWDNYGKWHVDHITPCASFDLTDSEQQKACFHYTNLQPLWAKDNLKKGAKVL